jgi:mannose-6-phosphate isomerase-like protein (cupin superfamily)
MAVFLEVHALEAPDAIGDLPESRRRSGEHKPRRSTDRRQAPRERDEAREAGASIRSAIEHPLAGERVESLVTAAETNGELVLLHVTAPANGSPPAVRLHPYHSDRFEILSGVAELTLGEGTVIARPGDVVTVEPGTPHSFRNVGEDALEFFLEMRPASALAPFVEMAYALAGDGNANGKPIATACACCF